VAIADYVADEAITADEATRTIEANIGPSKLKKLFMPIG
jgi:hypothetical protein